MTLAAACLSCKHLDREAVLVWRVIRCAAFPNGVPNLILEGLERHQEPYPGDHGIQYEELVALAPAADD